MLRSSLIQATSLFRLLRSILSSQMMATFRVQAPAQSAAVSPAPTLVAAPLSSDDERSLFDHEGGYYIEEMDGEGEL
jgi:hypothetical protein